LLTQEKAGQDSRPTLQFLLLIIYIYHS